jgi:hypothetical protein
MAAAGVARSASRVVTAPAASASSSPARRLAADEAMTGRVSGGCGR